MAELLLCRVPAVVRKESHRLARHGETGHGPTACSGNQAAPKAVTASALCLCPCSPSQPQMP